MDWARILAFVTGMVDQELLVRIEYDRGHACHHDHVADPKAGRARHLVEDEIGAVGNARHPHACIAHLAAGRLQPLV
jgi:hypothetical protein